MIGQEQAEGHTVVVHPPNHVRRPIGICPPLESHPQFVAVIAYHFGFAPDAMPDIIVDTALSPEDQDIIGKSRKHLGRRTR